MGGKDRGRDGEDKSGGQMGDQLREREKMGGREATGLQNICEVSVHNSFATGYEAQLKPAETSKHRFSLKYSHKTLVKMSETGD